MTSINDELSFQDIRFENHDLAQQPSLAQIPVSSYRLQLNKQFTFADATRLVPYLHKLGISHCYVSPFLKARAGSNHGYDIVDHSQLNPEIGSLEEFDEFIDVLQHHNMGLIADIVPNHMGIMGSDNNWWMDVLENGQASDYARFFDIDWQPVKKSLQNKILVPILGDHYGDILEQQALKLMFDAGQGEFSIVYYQHRFPVDPKTYPVILSAQDGRLGQYFEADDPVFLEYQTLENSFGKLPLRTQISVDNVAERKRDKEIFKKHLVRLCTDCLPIMQFITCRVADINRDTGESGALHELLEQQVYRLAYWRVAGDEINYRRFFDINDLAGLHMEDEKVFQATHQSTLSLIAQNKIQGIRIDHADGLYDPVGYYQRLNSQIAVLINANTDRNTPPIYSVAEKIVANYEYLASHWPIHGTTGYEFANVVNGVFINHLAKYRLTGCYARFIGKPQNFDELVYQAKRQVLITRMASELNVLSNQLSKIADTNGKTRDYTFNALRDALTEIIACFPVYRTYINSQNVSKQDSQYIRWATAQAERSSQAVDKTVFAFVRSVLLLEAASTLPVALLLKFVMKFQQYTAPVMAKGYEDTALYQYHRLISLNEVGGDPRHFSHSVSAFHRFNKQRFKTWPHTMLNLSTHDSKHAADVRARINVLSEVPEQWQAALKRWRKWNHPGNQVVVSRNDEYLFYQILIGTWPLMTLSEAESAVYCGRIQNYMIKAIREAKQNTSWINPAVNYEQTILEWVSRCLDVNLSPLFLRDFSEFEKRIRPAGLYNALAQNILLLTSPGMPDIYQGHEVWQCSLVDPDNRRPVDYDNIKQMADELTVLLEQPEFDRSLLICSLLANMADGRIKLFVMMLTLGFRQHYAELFKHGDYLPITIHGAHADGLLAFARQSAQHIAIILVPRLTMPLFENGQRQVLGEVWPDTWLELPQEAPELFTELFTKALVYKHSESATHQLFIKDILKKLPMGILIAAFDDKRR